MRIYIQANKTMLYIHEILYGRVFFTYIIKPFLIQTRTMHNTQSYKRKLLSWSETEIHENLSTTKLLKNEENYF